MTRRQSAIVLAATFVLGLGLGVALVQAHDVRLDEAMDVMDHIAAAAEAVDTDSE